MSAGFSHSVQSQGTGENEFRSKLIGLLASACFDLLQKTMFIERINCEMLLLDQTALVTITFSNVQYKHGILQILRVSDLIMYLNL